MPWEQVSPLPAMQLQCPVMMFPFFWARIQSFRGSKVCLWEWWTCTKSIRYDKSVFWADKEKQQALTSHIVSTNLPKKKHTFCRQNFRSRREYKIGREEIVGLKSLVILHGFFSGEICPKNQVVHPIHVGNQRPGIPIFLQIFIHELKWVAPTLLNLL